MKIKIKTTIKKKNNVNQETTFELLYIYSVCALHQVRFVECIVKKFFFLFNLA